MDFIVNLALFAVVFGVIVFVHELGHLLAAKKFKVYCQEFALGFGPKIFSMKKEHWETTYSIRAIPLGGFVSMAGEPGQEDMDVPYERTIIGIKRWQRLIVMSAGIFMNILLSLVIYWALFGIIGTSEPPKTIISAIVEDSPAQAAGFLPEDDVVSVTFYDGTVIVPDNFNDISLGISVYGDNNPILFVVERDGAQIEISLTPEYYPDEERYVIGVYPEMGDAIELNFFSAGAMAVSHILTSISQLFFVFGRLFRGIGLQSVGGPIAIYQVVSETTTYGSVYFFNLIAAFSLNLAILNALPIPVLDGGRVFLTVVEMIIRRPIPKKMENVAMLMGFALIILLYILVMYNDISKLL